MAKGLEAVVGWLNQKLLKLNPQKTEVLWLGGGISRLGHHLLALDQAPLMLVPTTKSPAMILDASLSLETKVTNVARLVLLQLCQIRQLALLQSLSDLTTVIHVMLTSRMDYYDTLYVSLPLRLIWNLQLVENAMAQVLQGPC